MRSTVICAIIFSCLIILSGIIEIKYLTNFTDEMIEIIDAMEEYQGVDKKSEKVIILRKKWDKNVNILSVLIDHQDIHKIESRLVEIEMILKNNFSSSQISTNFALLKLYIKDIADERKFILKNIL